MKTSHIALLVIGVAIPLSALAAYVSQPHYEKPLTEKQLQVRELKSQIVVREMLIKRLEQ